MAGLKVWYDREGDYLEVTFEEAEDDVFARRTPDGRVIGFAVFNFSKHDRAKLTLPLTVVATTTQ